MFYSQNLIYIGYTSTALTEAANNGLIAISLLYVLTPVSVERKNYYKNYLKKNLQSGIIYFPKNIESIISILNENRIKI